MTSHLLQLFFFLFFFSLNSLAQRYSFVEYSTPEGLPQTQVTSITQDERGYLWIGTLGGLAKFNGKNFTSYTRDNGLAFNKITKLVRFQDEIWIGHQGGVSLQKKEKFTHWYLPPTAKDIKVTGFAKYKNATFITTNGDGIYRQEGKTFKRIPLPQNMNKKIRDVFAFQETYFLATRNGLYKTENFQSFDFVKETYEMSISDIELKNDVLVVTTYSDGIFTYQPKTGKITPQKQIDKNLSLISSYCDKEGNQWILTYKGILKMDKQGQTKLINEEKGLPKAQIECIFEDNEKNIWLGSSGKGLIFFPGEQFVYFDQNSGLPSDLIININQDTKNQFWLSTYNKGLVFQHKTGSTTFDNVTTAWCSTMDVDGYNWFGSEAGLVAFQGEKFKKKYTKENGLLSDKITSLLKTSKNQMYIGGTGGLMLYKEGKITTLHSNIEQANIGTVRDMEFYKNTLYIATDMGLFRMENGKVKPFKKFSFTTYCIEKDNSNQLWMGTDEGLFSLKNNSIKNRAFATETASKFINFLNFSENKLFIGTNNGLYVSTINKKGEPERIEHFGIQEGVVNLETNINSGYMDKTGNFWFGTASGLMRYKNPTGKKKNYTPKIILQDILLNYKKIPFDENDLRGNLSMPASQNNISFEFDGISLSDPEEVYFQFWLEGVEEHWSPKTTAPKATFTGLRSGEYILHARTIGTPNKISKKISIPFTIRAPFYLTWWFILICLSVIGGMIYLFFKFKIRTEREKSEKKTIEFKNKLMLLEQQSLNASMNRHFIFNSLNSIQYFINTQDKISANKYLTSFAQLIRKNLDASSLNRNFLPFSKELERLELYLGLEAMRFKDRFTYEFKSTVENTDQILIPTMLLQPFVENSIVHGILPKKTEKGKIIIESWVEENILLIRISDNGIGISQSMKTKINSEGDHRSQGMEITTKRISLIKQMLNKGFEIIGPNDQLDENLSINGTVVLLKIPFETLD